MPLTFAASGTAAIAGKPVVATKHHIHRFDAEAIVGCRQIHYSDRLGLPVSFTCHS